MPRRAQRALLLLFAAMILGLSQARAQDQGPLVPAGYIRLTTIGARTSIDSRHQTEEGLVREELGVGGDGYVYAPTFLTYHGLVFGAVEQSYTSTDNAFANTLPWGYDARTVLFPEHIFQIRAFARRNENETLAPQLDTFRLITVRTQNEGVGLDLFPFLPTTKGSVDYVHEDTTVTGESPKREDVHDRVDGHARDERPGNWCSSDLRYLFDDYHEAISRFNVTTESLLLSNSLRPVSWLQFTTTGSLLDQRGDYSARDYGFSETATETIIPDTEDSEQSLKNTTAYAFDYREIGSRLTSNAISDTLTHRLFLSLTTSVGGRYSYYLLPDGHTETYGGFAQANYTKTLPLGGLGLNYAFSYDRTANTGHGTTSVLRESHVLSTASSQILAHPNVNPSSVVVMDAAGTTFYVAGTDYILIERGQSLELVRVPTGAIAEGATVLVDYAYDAPQDVAYDTISNSFSARYTILLLTLYDRLALLDQNRVSGSAAARLEHQVDELVGAELGHSWPLFDFKLVGEYRSMRSRITPFDSTQATASFGFRPFDGLRLGLTAGDYRVYYKTGGKTRVDSIVGTIETQFLDTGHASFEVGFRQEEGRGTDRDITSFLLHVDYKVRGFNLALEGRHDMGDYGGHNSMESRLQLVIERRF